jgi:hypothetical protein
MIIVAGTTTVHKEKIAARCPSSLRWLRKLKRHSPGILRLNIWRGARLNFLRR